MGVKVNRLGQRFGSRVIVEETDQRDCGGNIKWKWKCDCGNTGCCKARDLQKSLKCVACADRPDTGIDLTGQRFGTRVVLGLTSKRTVDGRRRWKCRCDCGKVSILSVTAVRTGVCASCGEKIRRDPAYRSWCSTLRSSKKRDIEVCDRWLWYENFFEDMGKRPKGMVLGRLDHSKGFDKFNCRWMTWDQVRRLGTQGLMYLKVYGKEKPLVDWCRQLELNTHVVRQRYNKGWPDKECLFGRPKKNQSANGTGPVGGHREGCELLDLVGPSARLSST